MNEHLAFAGVFVLTLVAWLANFAALSLAGYGYSRTKSVAALLVGFVAAAASGVFGYFYILG